MKPFGAAGTAHEYSIPSHARSAQPNANVLDRAGDEDSFALVPRLLSEGDTI